MSDKIPRAVSGSGQSIFDKIHKPLLSSCKNFDRVSSFFEPKGFAKAISEIAELWKSDGKIRLILSPADTSEIHQALQNVTEDTERKISSLKDSIEIAIRQIKGERPEIISALEEMLVNDFLQVAVVIPRQGAGLFHSKFSIYHISNESKIGREVDSEISKYVAVHGSFNETEAGYSRNIEDASTHRSWVSNEYEVAKIFKLRFDELWNDFAPDSKSIPIDDALRRALDLTKRSPSLNPLRKLTVKSYLNHISCIPTSMGFNDSIWLMPHQSSVVNSAMKHTPVRSMLCDEVGLGKTIQAGAIMSRLFAEKSCRRILIIAPASTLSQWAIEISEKFQFPVSIYRNNSRERYFRGTLIDNKRIYSLTKDPHLLKEESTVVVISSQWFRLRSTKYIEELYKDFDLMILDEAHHARLSNWKKRKGTQLQKRIKQISTHIPNVLLLTATPYQTGEMDFLSLLDILQPVSESDEEDMRIGAGVVSGELPWNQNQKAVLIRSIARRLELTKPYLSPNLYKSISSAQHPLGLRKLMKIIEENDIDEDLLFRTLPSSISKFTNTRSMLRDIGVAFPEVIFEPIPVEPKEYEEVLEKTDNFILKYLGGNEFACGLTRSRYYQRAVSSFAALHATLTNRRDNILEYEIEKADFDLDLERIPPVSGIEMKRIDNLLSDLEKVMQKYPDPKLSELVKLIDRLHNENRKTLIFSRYTATTSAIENGLWESFPELVIGRYDGEQVRIRDPKRSTPIDVTKEVLIKKLKNDEIDVIVCSDAASEGLNLQSASAVINVDVPWNPARVMQRIGRVDRLGQLSPTVVVHNLVYLDTIEERMYRVLDGRQTDAIRYLGEQPELFSTPESREMYQVFGVPIRERVDYDQSQTRLEIDSQRLINEVEKHNATLLAWVRKLIETNPELDIDENPASHRFVFRNEKILSSNLETCIQFQGELGYAICGDNIPHAFLIKSDEGYTPITPSILLIEEQESLPKWHTIKEAVEHYTIEFNTIQSEKRSAGLLSNRFPAQAKKSPEYEFTSI